MQKFLIGPMCVTKEDFEQQLNSCGLKFGYIKRLYEKWKDGDLTYFRIIIEGSPFMIVTDDESSYPEIQEETGKKIKPYSLEWLEYLSYDSNIIGPSFYESLMRHLQMYIRVKKAEKNDEKKKQNKCPYCHFEVDGEGKVIDDDRDSTDRFNLCKDQDGTFRIECYADHSSKIKFCPMCGRKLET